MNEATKNTIISFCTSFVMILAGIPAFASFMTPDLVQKLQAGIPTIVGAVSAVIVAGVAIYKAMPKSKESIVKGAAELPEVHQIVTTPAIAAASARPEVVAK